MKNKKNILDKLLFFLLVFLPIYKDSPLSAYFGAAGYTLVLPLTLIISALYIVLKKIKNTNIYLKYITNLGIWLGIVSVLGIIVCYILGYPLTYLGEFLPYKAIKVLLQYLAFPAYVMLLINCLEKFGEEKLFKYMFFTMIILTIIGLLERSQIPYAFEKIHFYGMFPYWRIRLLTKEASETTTLVLIYCLMPIMYYLKSGKKVLVTISSVCLVFLIYITQAKSLLLAIGIFVIIYIIYILRKLTKRKLLLLLLLFFIFSIFIIYLLPKFGTMLKNDIDNFTSTATRSYTFFISVIIGTFFPFGVGGGAYLIVLKSYLSKYLTIFDYLPIELNQKEIYTLINSDSDVALTVKSGIMDYNVHWGIFGTICLMRCFIKLSKKYRKLREEHWELILSLFWTNIIMLFLFCNFSFEFWIVFSYMAYCSERRKEN